ncbi:MAG: thioredoxin domain-containing protein [Polyangiaceae bacterium]
MNRLGKEASPYLLQHAHNPVDWFPWGSEALENAKREDKPILLSIGYSACHWCHVMERESFENAATAAKMNELFVNVKVDREERPDLDQIYQLVVQIMGRSGGWPLTVFLTPDQKPFFAGTYFPPEDRYGMPGFPKILEAVAEAYKTRRDELAANADEIAKAIAEVTSAGAKESAPVSKDLVAHAAKKLGTRFDDANGGFGSSPKFPNTMALEILLRSGTHGDDTSMKRSNAALHAMRAGGIYDQLGGGFHRYSTDAHWLVPHFEKMLYDNALLLKLYADAFVATKDGAYAITAREIATYAMREMRDAKCGRRIFRDARRGQRRT